MSEKEIKKTATRDISDLKARLGLKKGPDGTPLARPSAAHAIPAPPGQAKVAPPAAVGATPPPPPFGGFAAAAVERAESPRPFAAPGPVEDPFAAMNAMAAHGAAHAAPPLVLVDDHKPAPSLKTSSRAAYAKWGGLVLALLIVGFFVGGITYKNQVYNQTIDDAKRLTDEVRAIGKSLQTLADALDTAKERGPNKQDFLAGDHELTALLETLKLAKPEADRLYLSNLLNMNAQLTENTLGFYTDVGSLYDKVARHVRLAKADEKAGKGSDVLGKLSANTQFGAEIHVSKEDASAPPTISLVEVGAPICGDNQPHPSGCPDGKPPAGFQFRRDVKDSMWGSKPWAKSPEGISPDSLILLGESSVLQVLVQGAKPYYEEVGYMTRIREIEEFAKALILTRKAIEDRLNLKATEGKRFSL